MNKNTKISVSTFVEKWLEPEIKFTFCLAVVKNVKKGWKRIEEILH